MKKQWYDHKSVGCPSCHYHRPEGERDTAIGKAEYPEGCGLYGYSFHDYPEPADDCEGFITTKDYEADRKKRAMLEKKKKK